MLSNHKHTLQLAIIALLLGGCVAVLMPFIGTLLSAIDICIAGAPLRTRMLRVCRGRRTVTATVLCLLLVVLVVLTRKGKLLFKPIILVIMPFGLHSNRIMKVSTLMKWGFDVSWPIRLISIR